MLYSHVGDFFIAWFFTQKQSRPLSAEYTLIWNVNKEKISNQEILNHNHFIYNFNSIENIDLLIPYNYNKKKQTNILSVYIKPINFNDFILFKQFEIGNENTENEFHYFLKVL